MQFPGIKWKQTGISKGGQKKNSVKFPGDLVFGLGIFKGSNTIL